MGNSLASCRRRRRGSGDFPYVSRPDGSIASGVLGWRRTMSGTHQAVDAGAMIFYSPVTWRQLNSSACLSADGGVVSLKFLLPEDLQPFAYRVPERWPMRPHSLKVLLLPVPRVSLDRCPVERPPTTAEKRRSRLQTNPDSKHETVNAKDVASPNMIGLQYATGRGRLLWIALGSNDATLFRAIRHCAHRKGQS